MSDVNEIELLKLLEKVLAELQKQTRYLESLKSASQGR